MPTQQFRTTRWSTVLAAADRSSPGHPQALASLCEAYWYPLYCFVRRRSCDAAEAEELTQEFFLRLLEKDYLRNVSQGKGKFRTFLLVCLRRFLANEWDRRTAQKRGGGRPIASLDLEEAAERYRLEPADEMTPERAFERRWALTVLERVVVSLAEDMAASGKARRFEALKVYLTGEGDALPYAQAATLLGMSEGAVKVAVHRLRSRFREKLRSEVAETLADPREVDEELQCLLSALCT